MASPSFASRRLAVRVLREASNARLSTAAGPLFLEGTATLRFRTPVRPFSSSCPKCLPRLSPKDRLVGAVSVSSTLKEGGDDVAGVQDLKESWQERLKEAKRGKTRALDDDRGFKETSRNNDEEEKKRRKEGEEDDDGGLPWFVDPAYEPQQSSPPDAGVVGAGAGADTASARLAHAPPPADLVEPLRQLHELLTTGHMASSVATPREATFEQEEDRQLDGGVAAPVPTFTPEELALEESLGVRRLERSSSSWLSPSTAAFGGGIARSREMEKEELPPISYIHASAIAPDEAWTDWIVVVETRGEGMGNVKRVAEAIGGLLKHLPRPATANADSSVFPSSTSTTTPIHYEGLTDPIPARRRNRSTQSSRRSASESSTAEGTWVLVDAGWVVVHVMTPKARTRWDIEGVWDEIGAEAKREAEVWEKDMREEGTVAARRV